jgi:hypothetical protein
MTLQGRRLAGPNHCQLQLLAPPGFFGTIKRQRF